MAKEFTEISDKELTTIEGGCGCCRSGRVVIQPPKPAHGTHHGH